MAQGLGALEFPRLHSASDAGSFHNPETEDDIEIELDLFLAQMAAVEVQPAPSFLHDFYLAQMAAVEVQPAPDVFPAAPGANDGAATD